MDDGDVLEQRVANKQGTVYYEWWVVFISFDTVTTQPVHVVCTPRQLHKGMGHWKLVENAVAAAAY